MALVAALLRPRMQGPVATPLHFVAGTRWWPPFCLAVDWTVAGIIAIAIAAGVGFH